MMDFISQYSREITRDRINPDLFNRSFDRPLWEHTLSICKSLEIIPGIKIVDWELITDQTKIKSKINKAHSKDPKIKNNKALERFATINKTIYDLLIVRYRVTAKGQTTVLTRQIRIPKLIDGKWYIRNGKKVMPLIQVVDNSTFVKNRVLNFKTALHAITLSTTQSKLKFVDGDTLSVPCFHLDLFTKVTNPLLYYFAQHGLEDTIQLFGLERVISVVDRVMDEDTYMYLRVHEGVYIEVHEKAIMLHNFVSKFIGTLYNVLSADRDITLKDCYDKEYWLGRLAEMFAKKRTVNKGERVVMSFNRMTNPMMNARLKLRKYHRENSSKIVRWMMVNYDDLLKKDSHDLSNKRMRANETQTFNFDEHITSNIYSLLNTPDPTFERLCRAVNSITEYSLNRASGGSRKSVSPTSMFWYERYNDFNAIELSRYTLKGPTGLNGGKKKTSTKYRDIYPSHYGRYDINVCSSDPGLSGYLCANLQFDDTGHFDPNMKEPDGYDKTIHKKLDELVGEAEDYVRSRREHVMLENSRDKDGFIRLKRKLHGDELIDDMWADPYKYNLIIVDGNLRMMKKLPRDQKGFIKFEKPRRDNNRKKSKTEPTRDENGFIELRQTKRISKHKKK